MQFLSRSARAGLKTGSLDRDIRDALIYFDLWQYPLTADELYAFLPRTTCTRDQFGRWLARYGPGPYAVEHDGYFSLRTRSADVVARRHHGEKRARGMWRMARAAASLIKRFPFVRGVMVSGELSKNLATGKCDVDFFVIAEPGRVWIARTLLILFKKIFLLNRKKYFCVNTFTAADALEFDEKNLYTAAEIAYLKPIYGARICRDFAAANGWVKGFFPNFDPALIPEVRCAVSDTPSGLQRVLERLLGFLPLDRIDSALLQWMERVWARRYPGLDDEKRRHAFRSTKSESRTYPSDYQEHVLAWYEKQMNAFAGAIAELP